MSSLAEIAAESSSRRNPGLSIGHAFAAVRAVALREILKFLHQRERLLSAFVRPALWLIVFAAGFQNVLGVSILPPYETFTEYAEYMVPGLLGIILLFQSMQSSLSMVYDREMGVMRLLLTAPLPRWYLLFAKLLGAAVLCVMQAYVFLLIAGAFGARIPWLGWLYILPALFAGAVALGAVGLLLSVRIKQLENFAGTMNFVIFPMFFISTALFPIWKLEESGSIVLYWIASFNPFTHVVELVRFAAYGQFNAVSCAVVLGTATVFFLLAALGYDPQRGLIRKAPRGG